MPDSGPIVELRDVTKHYQQGALDVAALRGLSLSIKKGEFTAICGPSVALSCAWPSTCNGWPSNVVSPRSPSLTSRTASSMTAPDGR